MVAEYYHGSWTWYEGSNEWSLEGIVTHWMPLPEPPGYKCYNVNCGSCISKTLCGEPADTALGCKDRLVSVQTNVPGCGGDDYGCPTITPENLVKHGEIIETIEDGKMKRVFSCCGTDFTRLTSWITPNYCPNCGAKMNL